VADQTARKMLRAVEKLVDDYEKNCETFLTRIERHAKERQINGRGSQAVLDLLRQLENVRRAIRSKAPKQVVAWEAFELGRLHKEAKFERLVPDAQSTWERRESGTQGARQRWWTEERKQQAIAWKSEFDRLTSGPNPKSKKSALRILAQQHKCHPLTIRRRLDRLKPLPKKR
jgi:hypothetical protein